MRRREVGEGGDRNLISRGNDVSRICDTEKFVEFGGHETADAVLETVRIHENPSQHFIDVMVWRFDGCKVVEYRWKHLGRGEVREEITEMGDTGEH